MKTERRIDYNSEDGQFCQKTWQSIKEYSPTLIAGAIIGGTIGILGIGGANFNQAANPEIFEFIRNNPEAYKPLLNQTSSAIWVLSHPVEWSVSWAGITSGLFFINKYFNLNL